LMSFGLIVVSRLGFCWAATCCCPWHEMEGLKVSHPRGDLFTLLGLVDMFALCYKAFW
jgi:hypothetical protein